MVTQIAFGSLILGICSAIHISFLAGAISFLKRIGRRFESKNEPSHWVFLTTVAFIAVALAHTMQVWIWAASFVLLEVVVTSADAIYFALVTYTTLGYGDIVPQEGTRVFAAMAAVTGLLNFGLSTAFLVGLLSKLLPTDLR